MNTRLWLAWSAALALTVSAISRAAEQPRIQPGQRAPNWTLKNQTGEAVSLDQLIERGKIVAVVFYRSADW